MSVDPAKLLYEDQELLSYLPTVTFGYLWHITGKSRYLLVALWLLITATMIVRAINEDATLDKSNSWKIWSARLLFFIPWSIGFPAGAILIYGESGHGDMISVALILLNAAVWFLVINERLLGAIDEELSDVEDWN